MNTMKKKKKLSHRIHLEKLYLVDVQGEKMGGQHIQ